MDKCSKNCYHYDMCNGRFDCEDYGCECLDFKDKFLIVELPCRVGDTVYRISTQYHTRMKYLQETKISRIAIDDEGIWLFCRCNPIAKCVYGKTVFLTRDEAERALEECEKNAKV